MVLLGKNKLAKNFGAKRVGQPMNAAATSNANAFLANANALLNANVNGLVNDGQFNNNTGNDSQALAIDVQDAQLQAQTTLPAGADNTVHFETLVDQDGTVITYSEVDSNLDGQVDAAFIAALPAQQPQVVQEDICEFPAQSVQLVRDVLITNTAPEIIDVQTDICGNVISYTESMTRNMNATQWRAVNSAQLAGPLRAFSVNDRGTIINASGNVRLANSPNTQGFSVQPKVVQGPLVGGKKLHMSNKNASFGAASMAKWKGA